MKHLDLSDSAFFPLLFMVAEVKPRDSLPELCPVSVGCVLENEPLTAFKGWGKEPTRWTECHLLRLVNLIFA